MCAIQVDPWKKAEECERALELTTDLKACELLVYVENLWIALGNKMALLSSDELIEEIETVTQIQADMCADVKLYQRRLCH